MDLCEKKKFSILSSIIGVNLVGMSLFSSYYALRMSLYFYGLGCFSFAHVKYWFVKIFPILIFTPYYLLKTFIQFYSEKNLKVIWILKHISNGLVVSAIILTLAVIYNGMFLNVPLKVNFDLKWKYHTIYEWLFAFFAGYLLFIRKTKDSYMSINFAIQTVISGATIYELPVAPSIWVYLHKDNPFFIHTPLLSIVFLIHILRYYSWKPNRLFYFALSFYLMFSVFYYFMPNGFPGWIPRLPTIFLMLVLPTGIKGSIK